MAGPPFSGGSRPALWTAGRGAATPMLSRSSAANAVTIPTWITGRCHPGFSGSAGRTRSRRASQRMKNTSCGTMRGRRLTRVRLTWTPARKLAGRSKRGGFAVSKDSMDVLVAGYQDLDAARRDFDVLCGLVKDKQVTTE